MEKYSVNISVEWIGEKCWEQSGGYQERRISTAPGIDIQFLIATNSSAPADASAERQALWALLTVVIDHDALPMMTTRSPSSNATNEVYASFIHY